MPLLFNILSRLVIIFFQGASDFNFMAAVTICRDAGAQKNKVSHCFHCFPIYLPWSDGTRCHDLHFLECMVLSHPFHSSLTFVKKLFSSSLLSAIRVVSSAYLRLLIFLLAILIPAVLYPAQHFAWCTLDLSEIINMTIYSLDILLSEFGTIPCSMSSSNMLLQLHTGFSGGS